MYYKNIPKAQPGQEVDSSGAPLFSDGMPIVSPNRNFVDFTDVTWTQDDLDYANTHFICLQGECLDRSYQAYDKTVASYIPGMLSSSDFKKIYDFGSAPSKDWRKPDRPYYTTKDESGFSTGKVVYNPKPGIDEVFEPVSDKTQKWFESQRGFDLELDDFTVDSWDVGGVYMDEGAKLIFSGKSWGDKTPEERKKIYRSLPIGTWIGYGSKKGVDEGMRKSYNKEKGLMPSSHSVQVVGYAEDGEPIVYDYQTYRRISDHGENFSVYDERFISNIIVPRHAIGKDRDYFKKRNLLKKESKELNLDITDLFKDGDKDELIPFYNSLRQNKPNLMRDLKIDSKTYDEYAMNLLAIAMQETGGGTSPEHNLFGSTFGDTHGLTQLNIKNILNDEELKPIADMYGISDKSDLDDPYMSAIASMIFHKRHQKAANRAYHQGRKGPSTRTYKEKESEFFKDIGRSMQGKRNTYANNMFMTDEGIPIDLFKGLNYLGIGYRKSVDDIQRELDAVSEGKYKAGDKNGEIVITKNTLGNSELSPMERALYSWFGYNTLKTGDAQRNNAYYNNVMNYRNRIVDNNQLSGSTFQYGGEMLNTYKNYIMGEDESKQAESIFEKMNRKFYTKAKENNMSPANYIMSHIIK